MTEQSTDRYLPVRSSRGNRPDVGLVLVLGSVLPLTGAARHGSSRGAR